MIHFDSSSQENPDGVAGGADFVAGVVDSSLRHGRYSIQWHNVIEQAQKYRLEANKLGCNTPAQSPLATVHEFSWKTEIASTKSFSSRISMKYEIADTDKPKSMFRMVKMCV